MKLTTRTMAYAAVIAAVYAALCYAMQPIAFGAMQLRVSEALTLLPLLFPFAVPGLFVGCILANLASPMAFLDIPFGSLATLLAALLTWQIGRRVKNRTLALLLAPLPPVLCNAVIVGAMLAFTSGEAITPASFSLFALDIGVTEAIVCYVLGIPLVLVLQGIFNKQHTSL
ncbi:MAG: QueT transporter family protein [Eubacteriales bacterium]|jgi:uncharacterized membrane protein